MAFYIKVPPHMAEEMSLGESSKLPDGNYVAMITQFRMYCPTYVMEEKIPTMGCAIIRPWQLPEERAGKICTPLPEPTDPAFLPPEPPSVEEEVEEEVMDEIINELLEEVEQVPEQTEEETAQEAGESEEDSEEEPQEEEEQTEEGGVE